MSSQEKRSVLKQPHPTRWTDLVDAAGNVIAPWYGSGFTHDDAVRSAAKRWRIEQVGTDNQRRPGQPLP